MRELAELWHLEQLSQAKVPRLALICFMTAATELPEARALANEIAHGWEALTKSTKSLLDGEQLLQAIDQFAQMMLPVAGSPAVLAAAQPVQDLDAVGAALYLGEVLRHSVSPTRGSVTTASVSVDSPRASRSRAANSTAT
ncbi:hypothetical protein AB1Y20_001888 [Prymnesium parvum]|uniref:Uncharacterized protein n=1 Tax=Prymnesium parvum TaxID=97485 RepID=A0AB34J7C0_PRYPA